jgi:predicted ATPase/DNA-binding XRE family transcriptional regulator
MRSMGVEPTRFGELLRHYRSAGGLSQEYLAERARLSREAVSALERGARRAPYRVTVTLLADALGLSTEQRAELELAAAHGRARSTSSSPAPGQPLHNLPQQLTSFIGRERELGDLASLLAKHRLVTVTGSGGIGKTRLALEVATQLLPSRGDEIWFIDLSSLRDGTLVASKIAGTMKTSFDASAEPALAVAQTLRGRKVLLVVDNCEHLITGVAAVARAILQSCDTVTILATSRERIGIVGEATYRVAPLPESTAASLFIERAILVEPRFALTPKRGEIVADICRHLDGVPLAIELAAARLSAFGLSGLRERLGETRQRTMRATIEWSYNLLSEPERVLLRRVAIFSGGLTLEAAEAVCAGETLAAAAVPDVLSLLVDKSLINAVFEEEEARYVLLESVRAFALERLEAAGETTLVSRRHARWAADFADLAEVAFQKMSRTAWLAQCLPEFDNMRTVIEWALRSDAEDDAVIAGRIAGGLRALWYFSGNYYESGRWVDASLERIDEGRYPSVVARLLRAQLLRADGFVPPALIERAAALHERLGDRLGIANLHTGVATNFSARGRFEEAEEALAHALEALTGADLRRGTPYADFLNVRAFNHVRSDRPEEARIDIDELAALGETSGDETFLLYASRLRGLYAYCAGDIPRGIQIAEETLARIASRSAFSGLEDNIRCDLGCYKLVHGDVDGAESAGKQSLSHGRGDRREFDSSGPRTTELLAAVAAIRARPRDAALLTGFVDASYWSKGIARGPLDRQIYEILLASLREQLSQDQIDAFAAEGATLGAEAAAELALTAS